MRLGVVGARDVRSRRLAEAAVRYVREQYPDSPLRTDLARPIPELLVLIGDDRFFLATLRDLDSRIAVLTIGDGFLAEASPEKVRESLASIMHGEHWIEKRLRLVAQMGDESSPLALNEIALSTRRGGGFLRYSLAIGGENVWRDGGDGVVICTPTGSTGYGLSAGGPIVMENAEAIVVVPVCSANGQRPLVVPSNTIVEVSEVQSRSGCELVIDGSVRIRLKSSGYSVRTADQPVQFVRLGKARYLRTFGKLRTRQIGREIPSEAAPSAKYVFRLLSDQGPLTEKQLLAESGLPDRTVRSALAYLMKEGFVRRSSSLKDAREAIFSLRR